MNDCDALALLAGRAVQVLHVLQQVRHVVRARQRDLERLVAGDE